MCSRRVAWSFGILAGLLLVAGLAWYRATLRDVSGLMPPAIAAANRGDYPRAIILLDQILQRDPQHASALLYRAQIARDQGQIDLALQLLKRVPETRPQQAGTARFFEGSIQLEANRANAAERLFLRSIELHPTYLQPRERLVQLYLLQLRGLDLRSQLEAIRKQRPWSLSDLVVYHGAFGKVNRPDITIPILQRYVETDPTDINSALALAQYYLIEERFADAATLLQTLLAGDAANHSAKGLLGECLLLQSDIMGAEKLLGISSPPPDAPVALWRAHGLLAARLEDWPRAIDCLNRVVNLHPDDLQARYQLGLALERAGHPEESKRQFAKSRLVEEIFLKVSHMVGDNRAKDGQLFAVVRDTGLAMAKLDRHADAVLWFEQALALRPHDQQMRTAYQGAVQARGAAPVATEQLAAEITASHTGTASAKALARTRLANVPKGQSLQPDSIAQISLTDCQKDAGLDFQYFNGDTGFKYIIESLGGGVAFIDFDGDDWPDLHFTQGCKLPFQSDDHTHRDRLYKNRGDGNFEDVSESCGVTDHRYGQGCSTGDFDNDGFPDLFIANVGSNCVYHNNGDGTFTDVTPASGIAGDRSHSSVAWADLDRDGNLDLYVATYVLDPFRVCPDQRGVPATCSPANFHGEQDVLYRNLGDGTFEDLSDGIIAPDGRGLGVVVTDLDDDGWPDIYVANDGTPNFLFRNRTGESGGSVAFHEQGMISGAAVSGEGKAQAGMGIACADFDGDGRPDLHVTNFYNEYNTLYLNQGSLMFTDATRQMKLVEPTLPMLGFGTQAVDFDLDGWPDLFVANGHIDDKYAQGGAWKMPPQLFHNRRGIFSDASDNGGTFFQGRYLGRGVASGDWNRDGRPDLVVVHQDRPVGLLRNDTISTGAYLTVHCRGVKSNRDALGARVTVVAGGRTHVQQITGGNGFFASNDRQLTFGLGTVATVESVEVAWPSGIRDRWNNPPINQRLTCIEGSRPVPITGILIK